MASSLAAGPGTGIEGLEVLRRSNFEILARRIDSAAPLPGKKLLEVGSAKGWFLEAAARRGAAVRGIEPEVANAEIARANGFDVELGLFPDGLINRGPYDVIVFNDVLEHIPGPRGVIRDVAGLLAPGGLAVVNLPSSDGAIYHIARSLDRLGLSSPYERLWQKGFPSPHISYFNPANLRFLAERDGLMARIDAFALPSLSRDGLGPRIRSSHPGLVGGVLHAGVWLMTFVAGVLPADIHVSVFARR